ncbi:MAG: hypothetical protein ACLRWP_20650 [Bilophila wadsworthia]
MNAVRAEEERARAEAVAAANKPMRLLWRARHGELARELAAKTAELDAERASINKRIGMFQKRLAVIVLACREWVRLYNGLSACRFLL